MRSKDLTETVSIPLPLLKELYEHFDRIEEILATLEELSDKEGLKRIEKGLEEYKKKEYITASMPENKGSAHEGLRNLPYKIIFLTQLHQTV